MSEKLHRRKVILFLIAISLFGYFVAKKTGNVKITDISANEYVVEESIELTGNECNVVQDIFYEVDNDFKPVRQVYPAMVLSADSSGECRTADLVYSSERICSAPSLSLDKDWSGSQSGEKIKADSKIWLTSIEVPPLLSGSPTMDSSVRQIHKDDEGNYHWTLKPSGEMVNKEIVLGNTYPGDEKTKEIVEQGEMGKTQPYAVEYRVEAGGDAQGGGESEYTVDQYYENDCGSDCRNDPNPTPEKYSKASEVLAKSVQYPGYYENIENESEETLIEECDSNARLLNMDIEGTSPVACTPTLKQVVISFANWLENVFTPDPCSDEAEDNGNCVSVADIIIIMESPWGTKQDCNETGLCVNEYNNLRTGAYKSPSDSKDSDIYVLTDCVARIEGIATSKTLKCAWDVNYIAKELQFQSVDNVPGEEYPDTMEYMDFHIYESENRDEYPLSM